MVEQTTFDYSRMFSDLVARLTELTSQRDQANMEIAKLKQLIVVTFAMMPEDRQLMFQKEVDELQAESSGLSEAIRLVFSAHKGEPLTPTQVRDYLVESGFDFRQYTANPLASIATTLKRMTPDYLTIGVSESGQATYMRRLTLLDQMGREGYRNALAARVQGISPEVERKARNAMARKPGQAPIPPHVRRTVPLPPGSDGPPKPPDFIEDALNRTFKKK